MVEFNAIMYANIELRLKRFTFAMLLNYGHLVFMVEELLLEFLIVF